MGEKKSTNNQEVDKSITDQQQRYGSHHHGRHNLEENSLTMTDESNEEIISSKQHITNRQFQDTRVEDQFFDSSKIDDENYQYSSLSKLNKEDEMVFSVEGDDKDILGETENARRNEQKIRAKET